MPPLPPCPSPLENHCCKHLYLIIIRYKASLFYKIFVNFTSNTDFFYLIKPKKKFYLSYDISYSTKEKKRIYFENLKKN